MTKVEIDGPRILVDGRSTTLFGFRVGSAPLRDDWTQELVEELPVWREHGINSLTVWLQGTSGGFARTFTADGSALAGPAPVTVRANYGRKEIFTAYGSTTGAEVITRTRRIIDEAARHGMVVIVGFVYIHSVIAEESVESLTGMMRTAAAPFADCENVILNIWNEPRADAPLQGPDQIRLYLDAAAQTALRLPIGTGYQEAEQNQHLAGISSLSLFLMDAGRDLDDTVAAYDLLKTYGKPVINVESFGGRGNGYVDRPGQERAVPQAGAVDFEGWRRVFGAWKTGDYEDASGKTCIGQSSYKKLVDYVASDRARQCHLMLHIASWYQGASRVAAPSQIGDWRTAGHWNSVFNSGKEDGDGTVERPGIHWLLDHVAGRAG